MSLSAIVAIGVAFFVGLTSSSTMMASNVDTYNDENNLKDITVYSSYGFDDSDEKAIKDLKNVKMRKEPSLRMYMRQAADPVLLHVFIHILQMIQSTSLRLSMEDFRKMKMRQLQMPMP
jgi:hypothetical protein